MNGHGFFWFYFVNEHFLRFLGRRYPMDYNKLPSSLYWTLHLVWLFPWSLFCGVVIRQAAVSFARFNTANPSPTGSPTGSPSLSSSSASPCATPFTSLTSSRSSSRYSF